MLESPHNSTESTPWDAVHRGAPAAAAATRSRPERRARGSLDPVALRAGLTPGQLATLQTMEAFHWHLHFVRRPLFQPPIPVLFDRDGKRYVVILEDGALDEQPTLVLRN